MRFCVCVELKRPTANGLETGPVLFSPEEVKSIFEADKKVKRLFFMQRLPVKDRGDEDGGKTYIGQW